MRTALLTSRIDGHRGDDLRVGVVGVKGQRVASAHLDLHQLAGGYGLEHVHHVLVCVAQHTLAVYVHQHVTCNRRGMA